MLGTFFNSVVSVVSMASTLVSSLVTTEGVVQEHKDKVPLKVKWDEDKELKMAHKNVSEVRRRNGVKVFSITSWAKVLYTELCTVNKELEDTERQKKMNARKKLSAKRKAARDENEKKFHEALQRFSRSGNTDVPTLRDLLSRDIANQLEDLPIPAYSETGKLELFTPFEYIVQNEVRYSANKRSVILKCNCKGSCGTKCLCVKANAQLEGVTMSANGIIKLKDPRADIHVSCGPHCGCKGNCCRSITKYLNEKNTHQFELLRKNDHIGFGVRVMTAIKPGEIVIEFTGEVVTETELAIKLDENHSSYAFRLFESSYGKEEYDQVIIDGLREIYKKKDKTVFSESLHIDPYKKGNIARFLSHSCFPNVGVVRVISNYLDPKSYRIFFVANQPIAAGEELSFDYGIGGHPVGNKVCLCGQPNCRVVFEQEWALMRLHDRIQHAKTKADNAKNTIGKLLADIDMENKRKRKIEENDKVCEKRKMKR